MKNSLKITIIIFLLTHIQRPLHAQKNNPVKNYNVNYFLPVEKINSIEIYNSWTQQRRIVNRESLNKIKSVLNKSYASKSIILKPGHLYIKFNKELNLNDYDAYMYNDVIIFDPFINSTTYKPIKNKYPFTIFLNKKINWEKLK